MIIGIDEVKKLWIDNLTPEHMFQLYIHSPFCKTICKFCAYKGAPFNIANFNKYYYEYLPRLIDSFSDIISSHEIESIYFGGGTPSLMRDMDMMVIFNKIPGIKEVSNKYFEIHPTFFSREKMKILADFNFQTVTFGIQTFNNSEIKRMNRYHQDYKQIVNLIKDAKSFGLKIGIDLLVWEGNRSLGEDLEIAEKLGFDVIFASVDYILPTADKNYYYFSDEIDKFLKKKTYIRDRSLSTYSDIVRARNVRLFKGQEIDTCAKPGTFWYDSRFDSMSVNTKTATLGLGSFGKQMEPTTSYIGKRIFYQEINDDWTPRFDVKRNMKPFAWER